MGAHRQVAPATVGVKAMTPRDGTGLAVQLRATAMPPAPSPVPAIRLLGVDEVGGVTSVASSASYLVAAVGQTGVLRLADLADPADLAGPGAPPVTLGAHGAPVQALVACGGTVYSAGCDGRVLGWRLAPASLPVVVGAHRAGVTSAAVAPAGHLVAAGHDGYVLAWTGPVPETLATHPGGVEVLCLLGSGALVTAGRDGRLLWHDPLPRAAAGRADAPVELHQRRRELATALAPAGAGGVLTAIGHRGTIRLWTEPAGDPCPEELGIHGAWVLALVTCGDGRVAALGGGHVTVWDLSTGSTTRIGLAPAVHATGGAVLPSGDLAVTACDGRVEVVETRRWAA
jgi:hypothetical protein